MRILFFILLLIFGCDEPNVDDTGEEFISGTWYAYSYEECSPTSDCETNCDVEAYPIITDCEIIHVQKWTFNNDNTFTVVSPYQSCNENDGSWNTSESIRVLDWSQSGNTLYLEHPDGDEPLYESTGFNMQYIQGDSLHLQMILGDYDICLKAKLSANKYSDYNYEN